MALDQYYKYSLIKFAPFLGSPDYEENIDQIMYLLEDERDEDLKNSDLVTTSQTYGFVIDFYQEMDEIELKNYWVTRFHDMYPQDIIARVHYCRIGVVQKNDLKGLTNIEEMFSFEIDLLVHDKAVPVHKEKIYHDGDLAILAIFLIQYFSINGRTKEAKELYKWATSMGNAQLKSDAAFLIQGKERQKFYFSEPDPLIADWCKATILQIGSKLAEPFHDISYTLLNKDLYSWNEGDITELKSIKDPDVLEQDLSWALNCGIMRVFHQERPYNVQVILNVLYMSSHYRLHGISELILNFFSEMPDELFDEVVGDVGIGVLQQPLSIMIHNKPELVAKFIKDSTLQDYHKSLFFDILCYTARITGGEKERTVIAELWKNGEDEYHGMLGYYINAIVDHEISGYEKAIQAAYAKGLVDLKFFDKIEDMKPMVHMRKYDAHSLSETDLVSMVACYKRVLENMNHRTYESLEEEIEATIAETMDYDDIMNGQMGYEDDASLSMDDFLIPVQGHSETIKRESKKVGRNDPCPCGSGNKFKKCCLNMN